MKRVSYFFITLFALSLAACFDDLNTVPIDDDILTSEVFYRRPGAYRAVLAKIYAGLATTGQQGPAGQGDLAGIDEGFSQYLRQYWYQQELTTDEAVVGWADATIKDFHDQDWTPADVFINAFYNRIFYQIGICNEFLRQSTDELLDLRNTPDALRQEIAVYRTEARFMRALSYWHALDEFRNVPFVTEEDEVGAFNPRQIKAPELFDYIESELRDIESKLLAPHTNEYARADQAAAWMLLTKLYLNAEVYTGQKKYTEALTYAKKVIDAGYRLEPEYAHLFLADNDKSGEIIFPVAFDGLNTQTWGGTTFLIHASLGGQLDPAASGVDDGWAGLRTTPQIVEKFGEIGGVIRDFYPKTNHPQVYIPGPYQGNDPTQTEYAVTDADGDKVYEGHQYFEAPTTLVFAPYPTLSFVYGDNDNDGKLEVGGAPIKIGEAGFYFIQFDDNNKTYKIEKRQWAMKGSSLEEEVVLVWDADLKMLTAKTNLKPGNFYFLDKNSTNTTLGDNAQNGWLSYGGAPIEVAEGAPVEVFLDIRKEQYTYKIVSTAYDRRGIFGTKGQSLEIDDITDFTNGYAVLKFKNITSTGEQGSHNKFPDTDFPLFRLADAYLMAAEAILRGASGGSKADAVRYFNAVRSRAYQSDIANLTESTLTLQEILDERARELMWEGHRRTDLIRFGKFSESDYLWQWKGGVKEGTSVPAYRNVFPIPSKDLNNNPNLVQNDGY